MSQQGIEAIKLRQATCPLKWRLLLRRRQRARHQHPTARSRVVRGERLTPELGDARLRARKEERAAGAGDFRRRA